MLILLRKHYSIFDKGSSYVFVLTLEILSYSAANMTKKCHVYEEFSTPQLPNKYLLIISNWPSFASDRWLGHMKALVIVRVAPFMWRGGGAVCDAAVKNKNGRLSFNRMTSFLSFSLPTLPKLWERGKKNSIWQWLGKTQIWRRGLGDHRGYTHVSEATTLQAPSNLDV